MYDLFVDETSAPTTGAGRHPRQPRAAGRPIRTCRAARALGRRARTTARYRGRAAAAVARGRGSRGPGGGHWRPRRWPQPVAAPAGERPARRSISRLDRDGLLPAITFIFSRVGCEAAVGQLLRDGIRLITEAGGRADPPHRRGAGAVPGRRGPRGARLLGLRRGPHPRVRGPPRRDAADVPRDRRGAVHRGPDPGGVRHRDPRPRHQHAGAHRGAREAGQVQRRDPRRHHPRRVHPADRPGRPARHRRRGPRASCCGTAAWTRWPSPASRRPAPTRCARASGPPTTWPSTSSPRSAARRPARSSRRRSPSSRPTAPSSAWRGPCAATRRASRATPRRCSATSATSRSMPPCATRSRRLEKEGAKDRVREQAGRGGGVAWRRCGSATSSDPVRPPRRLRRRRAARQVLPGETPASPTVVTEDKQLRRLTLVDVPDAGRGDRPRVKVPPHFNAKSPKSRTRPRHARCASPCRTTRRPAARAAREAHAGSDEDAHRRAAPPAQGPPVPPVPRPRGPRPVGRAVVAAQARDGGPAAQGRGPHQLGGPDLRPDLHPARRDGLPVRRRRPSSPPQGENLRRLYTEKDLLAAECLRLGVWKRLDPAGPRGRRVGPDPRAAPRRGRPVTRGCPTRTSPRRSAR